MALQTRWEPVHPCRSTSCLLLGSVHTSSAPKCVSCETFLAGRLAFLDYHLRVIFLPGEPELPPARSAGSLDCLLHHGLRVIF